MKTLIETIKSFSTCQQQSHIFLFKDEVSEKLTSWLNKNKFIETSDGAWVRQFAITSDDVIEDEQVGIEINNLYNHGRITIVGPSITHYKIVDLDEHPHAVFICDWEATWGGYGGTGLRTSGLKNVSDDCLVKRRTVCFQQGNMPPGQLGELVIDHGKYGVVTVWESIEDAERNIGNVGQVKKELYSTY